MYNIVFFLGVLLVLGTSLIIHTSESSLSQYKQTDFLLVTLCVCILVLSLPLVLLPSKNRVSYFIHIATMKTQIILLKLLLYVIQANDQVGYVIACHTSQYLLIELAHIYQGDIMDILVILITPFYMLYHYNIYTVPKEREQLYLAHLLGILITHMYTYMNTVKNIMVEIFY
jgi:hypothetical protein